MNNMLCLPLSSEKIKEINDILFSQCESDPSQTDVCLILGSSNCGYRIQKALEYSAGRSDMYYIVSGAVKRAQTGNTTEADYMHRHLTEKGIPEEQIIVEDSSNNTAENILLSIKKLDVLCKHLNKKTITIAVITAGFHMKRTMEMIGELNIDPKYKFCSVPAYGPNSGPDNWHKTAFGIYIINTELAKLAAYEEQKSYTK